MKSEKIVNNLRVVGCETITNAKSGHPGVVLSGAPIFYAIYKNLKTDSENLKYFNRDFFVNSAGHSSALLYAVMNLFSLNITKTDLQEFRKINSKTPGHPEISTNGVDCATGPLGQGVANAVGIAIAAKHMGARFNKEDLKIFNNYVYCFLGDGCLMEGVAQEAFSIASKLKLDNLIFIYDRNNKTIEGNLDITYSENTIEKFKAMNFNVQVVEKGNDADIIEKAIINAKQNCGKPNIIIVDTIIGYGSHVEDSEISHGKPFSDDEIVLLKNKFKINNNKLEFLPDVKSFVDKINVQKQKQILKEKKLLEKYKKLYPQDYEKLEKYFNFDFNNESVKILKSLNYENNLSTRQNNSFVLNKVSRELDNIIGGSADVNTSTLAYFKEEKYFNEDYKNRNIHYGVREHAMGAISNGICLFGGLNAYCSCYLSFSDYLKPALRMSCLMNLPVFYQFSHDNVLIGQDGPTHQPVEQLVTLRATPNMTTFRPYNLTEILAAYEYYLTNKTPTTIILSKEKVNNKVGNIKDALKGAYVLKKEEGQLKAVILTSGCETEIALEIAQNLKGIRVVSMPCHELFDKQSAKYKQQVLGSAKRIVLEFSSKLSYYKYANDKTLFITLDEFGKSGSTNEIKKEFGFDTQTLIKKIKTFISKTL